jgi:hypothetical protein
MTPPPRTVQRTSKVSSMPAMPSEALLRGDEVDVGFLLVDGEFAAAWTEEDAGDGGFTPAGSVVLDQICHGAP